MQFDLMRVNTLLLLLNLRRKGQLFYCQSTASTILVNLPDALGLVCSLVLLVVDILEDVLEGSVVLLEDGVLGGHVERVSTVQGVFEATVGKVLDGLGRVVHAHGDAGALQ